MQKVGKSDLFCTTLDSIRTHQFVNNICLPRFSYVNSEEKILHILANYGPVTVAVNAMLWQHYLGGIIQYHCDGAIANLNHAVLIVGYDRTGDIPHYIAQNSWGSDFGDNGYVKIAYGKNVCGIANQVSTIKLE